MTLVCILPYAEVEHWRTASEVRRYLAENYGPDRVEKELTGAVKLPSGQAFEYRGVLLAVSLGAGENDCDGHRQKLLDLTNGWYTRFGLPRLPPAHVYCYPL